MQSLSFKFNELVMIFKRCITQPPKTELSVKSYIFGAERVVISTQIHRNFCVSYHVELSLFGLLFKYLDAGEIIVKTKKQVLMYIFSQKKNGGTV